MPSPIGHGLAAVAAGWIVARPATPRRAFWIQTATLAAIGIAPDLDLLINRHGAETHSLGAAVIVASVAAWWRWPVAHERWRIWLAVFAAWATHPLLDSLAEDASVPIGVLAFWPVSGVYLHTGLDLFISIWRHWWETGWFAHNLAAVTREVVILLPMTLAVWWWRSRGARAWPTRGAGQA